MKTLGFLTNDSQKITGFTGQLRLATDHSEPLTSVTRVLTQTTPGTLGELPQSGGVQPQWLEGISGSLNKPSSPGEWSAALGALHLQGQHLRGRKDVPPDVKH